MLSRSTLMTALLSCAAVLQLVALDGGSTSVALMTVVLACAMAAALAAMVVPTSRWALAVTPCCQRLRGSFPQQSRPGVPGRVRSRAPGSRR